MLDVQLSFDKCDYEHASVIKTDFYHLQNMPQIKCCPASQGYTFCYNQIEIAINSLSVALPETRWHDLQPIQKSK